MQRVLVVAIGSALLVGVSWATLWLATPTEQLARGFLGEKWYQISLGNDHVGYMHNQTYRDAAGRWHFDATTHFLLATNEPVNLFKRLVFAARTPFSLESASYSSFREGSRTSTSLQAVDDGFRTVVERGSEANELDLDWQFSLTDFLAVELWLHSSQPQALEEMTTKSLDFERLKITRRAYRVTEHNDVGYLLENAAPYAATRTQLNQDFHPTFLSMAGIFDVMESSREAALSLDKLRQKTSYLIPLDQRLVNHTRIKRLTLRVDYTPGDQARLHRLPDQFTLEHSPVNPEGDAGNFIGETLLYPVSHPGIQALAQRVLAESGKSRIEKLVNVTHAQLQYSENNPAGSVLRALERRRGECTDFADLLTTLARAIGLPARTVFGLAYKDSSKPAFMFHAWNEVFADNRWQSVDPTWNQVRVDATHIPLDNDQAAAMLLASGARAVRLSVIGTWY